MEQATAIVNENIARIPGTLRAIGSVDGYVTPPDGKRRSFHLDGTLFFLSPSHVRFDLKSFGSRQLLIGSNDSFYWYFTKDDGWHCEPHGAGRRLAAELPARPGQLIDALGLTAIPALTANGLPKLIVQRVVADYQQLLFVAYNGDGEAILEKEYWLDRFAPRLVRRVVFRDIDGVDEMIARLDDYLPLSRGGPLLPHLLEAEWPKERSGFRFRVGRWRHVSEIGPEGIQFAEPDVCSENPR